jgi:hypothetical protein
MFSHLISRFLSELGEVGDLGCQLAKKEKYLAKRKTVTGLP